MFVLDLKLSTFSNLEKSYFDIQCIVMFGIVEEGVPINYSNPKPE